MPSDSVTNARPSQIAGRAASRHTMKGKIAIATIAADDKAAKARPAPELFAIAEGGAAIAAAIPARATAAAARPRRRCRPDHRTPSVIALERPAPAGPGPA